MRRGPAVLALLIAFPVATLPARPAGAAVRLSLADAVSRAVAQAAPARIADLGSRQAEEAARAEKANLYPSLGATAFQRNWTYNLAALGFSPGESGDNLVGPVDAFDARLEATQPIVDVSLWKRIGAARAEADASRADARTAASDAAYRAALAYLRAARARALIAARQTDLDIAQELLSLARTRLEAGTAASIDVIRAETEATRTRGLLLIARRHASVALVDLARAANLPPGSPVELADSLSENVAIPVPVADSAAVAYGLEHRDDLRSAEARVVRAQEERASVSSERIPRLELGADYGLSGTKPSDSIATRQIGLYLAVPLWDGFRREHRISERSIAADEARLRADDLALEVEADVRKALLLLESAIEQQDVARQRLDLAQTELNEARERFSNGIAGNLEVIDAQKALNEAREAVIDVRTVVASARVELARAAGVAETVRLP